MFIRIQITLLKSVSKLYQHQMVQDTIVQFRDTISKYAQWKSITFAICAEKYQVSTLLSLLLPPH